MHVKVTIEVDGRKAGEIDQVISGKAAVVEEACLELGRRTGRIVLEYGLAQISDQDRAPVCCQRAMGSRGQRPITVLTMTGPVTYDRRRYRCGDCGAEVCAGDAEILCGTHRVTRPVAKRLCQLAATEHFTRLPQLALDQHGIEIGHEEIAELVHDVGGHLDRLRQAEAVSFRTGPGAERTWPEPIVTPARIHVSCDGIMYCTNQREPDPKHPGQTRLIWQQMRVGCVYWQDDRERWHKRVIWGREDGPEFGAALFRLACQCGYRQAKEKLFTCDGGDWCWTIHALYFSEATGILDWYHASEHVWATAHALFAEDAAAISWADQALALMRDEGGAGLMSWLSTQLSGRRGKARKSLNALMTYVRTKQHLMDYPDYRAAGWPIGSGMIESTGKQLVGLRLKGPGMHWTEAGALAVTALRATDLNGDWHPFWNSLTLTKCTATK
jgi:hypothetical protein